MKLKSEVKWLWHDITVWFEKLEIGAWMALPDRVRHRLVAREIGGLTTEPLISHRIVGDICVDDLFRAMRYREDGPVALYDDIWILPHALDALEHASLLGTYPDIDPGRLAYSDLVLSSDGWIIKDRYGRVGKQVEPELMAAAQRRADSERIMEAS